MQFLAICLLLIACLFGSAPVHSVENRDEPGASTRPNVLFLAVDDLSDWPVGPNEKTEDLTPNISELASRGVRFSNAHAPATMCNPSRVAVLSGLSPHRTGVFRNDGRSFRESVGHERKTIFQHFRDNGYYLAGSGKLFHQPDITSEPWDEYEENFGRRPSRAVYADPPIHGLQELLDATTRNFIWGLVEGEDHEWGDHEVATFGIDFLQRTHGEPFFLALGFSLPHLGWFVPQEYWDSVPEEMMPVFLADDRSDLPAKARNFDTGAHKIITEANKWHEAVRAYLASAKFIDRQIGRLLGALDASEFSENTIIVLWSDHGFQLGEKEYWRKGSLWEVATRVPFIFVANGVARENSISTKAVSLLDLYPTLSELAGLPEPQGVDGVSLVNLLRDPDSGDRETDFAVTSDIKGDALRNERWRYINYSWSKVINYLNWPYLNEMRWPFIDFLHAGEELYDHAADPNEHINLADDPEYAEVKQELKTQLADYIQSFYEQ